MTLTEFLLARITEEQSIAHAAIDDGAHWAHLGDGHIIQGDTGLTVSSGWLQMPHRIEAADHIALWDPARVLAECEIKRWMVDIFGVTDYSRYNDPMVIRKIAILYADHPDYRQEWRP